MRGCRDEGTNSEDEKEEGKVKTINYTVNGIDFSVSADESIISLA